MIIAIRFVVLGTFLMALTTSLVPTPGFAAGGGGGGGGGGLITVTWTGIEPETVTPFCVAATLH